MLFPIVASAVSIAIVVGLLHVLEPNGLYNYFFGRRLNPANDIPDLTGKVILVTGGMFQLIFVHGISYLTSYRQHGSRL